jgi:hypothetical protein
MRRELIQLGYVTADIEKALDFWIGTAKAGPFYYADYEPEQQRYRGEPTHIRFRVAYGYLGDMQFEAIQQLESGPSAYTEALESAASIPAGGILHHALMLHDGYDAAVGSYVGLGAEPRYTAFVPGVGRFCYLDARHLMGCHLEFVEDTTDFEAACVKMREAHREWDGSRGRRDFFKEILGF